MKQTFLLLKGILLVCFLLSFFFTLNEISGTSSFLNKFNYNNPEYNGKEEFDPSLQRLNSLDLITAYCDSIYESEVDKKGITFSGSYTNIVQQVIRKRFYHGYSTFGFGNNYVALLGESFYKKGISSVVIPDELLKFPFAACSQQSIIVMEILKSKGFVTRKVGFPPVNGTGHFCLEVYYNNAWHFIDTDMEADMSVLGQYNYPDVSFLAANKDIVRKVYMNNNPERAVSLFGAKISYGNPNAFPANTGRLYQNISKFLSYSLWIFFGLIFFIVRKKSILLSKKHVWNSRVPFPHPKPGASPSYYPGVTAQGA
jgi:hypothetical protein